MGAFLCQVAGRWIINLSERIRTGFRGWLKDFQRHTLSSSDRSEPPLYKVHACNPCFSCKLAIEHKAIFFYVKRALYTSCIKGKKGKIDQIRVMCCHRECWKVFGDVYVIISWSPLWYDPQVFWTCMVQHLFWSSWIRIYIMTVSPFDHLSLHFH